MIFVTSGTSEKFSFDRLVRHMDFLVRSKRITDPVFIQLGSGRYEPTYCQWQRFLPFDEIKGFIKEARLVISHAGAGTTLLCLTMGKKPILVPRMKEYEENVDNHQILFAKRMEELGCASAVYEVDKLLNVMEGHNNDLEKRSVSTRSQLVNYLETLISS